MQSNKKALFKPAKYKYVNCHTPSRFLGNNSYSVYSCESLSNSLRGDITPNTPMASNLFECFLKK